MEHKCVKYYGVLQYILLNGFNYKISLKSNKISENNFKKSFLFKTQFEHYKLRGWKARPI